MTTTAGDHHNTGVLRSASRSRERAAALAASGVPADIDLQFASLVCRLAGTPSDEGLFAAAALASFVTQNDKHVCLDLRAAAGKRLGDLFPDLAPETARLRLPAYRTWLRGLRASAAVGRPKERRPLILDDAGRLYLYRYWRYEQTVAEAVRTRCAQPFADAAAALVRNVLRDCSRGSRRLDPLQTVAAVAALLCGFCVISGGPGTGKTFIAAVILSLLQGHDPHCRIRLCAPTGKAAFRLQESLAEHLDAGLHAPPVATIHRLLGARQDGSAMRYHRGNPLPADAVIIDEASMVPLAIMAKLADALPPHCRLILLGDKDQLASVEAGSVLGDICGAFALNSPSPLFGERYRELTGETLPDMRPDGGTVCADGGFELRRSYRFDPERGIGALSDAVRRGDAGRCMAVLADGANREARWRELPGRSELAAALAATVRQWIEPAFNAATVEKAFAQTQRFKILCALRNGPYGVAGITRVVETMLAARGMINPGDPFYHGRPVIVTRNDYTAGLFNGDTGILASNDRGDPMVFFPCRDAGFRSVSPALLPDHETAYGLTIHKAQGSEYDHVLIILPDRDMPLLTRELLYTGITRARSSVEIWAPADVLGAAVSRRYERASGLRESLMHTT